MTDSRNVTVVNEAGLHARPCHAIVSLAMGHPCSLRIRSVGNAARDVNGKSILELMTLEALQGVELELSAEGEGAAELLDELARLFSSGFGERESAG
jgi:phosphocarrier protein